MNVDIASENANEKPLTSINRENMRVSGIGVRYYALSDSYSERDSIKSQLRQNEAIVNSMSPVDEVNYIVTDKQKARNDAKTIDPRTSVFHLLIGHIYPFGKHT